jgi:hypothetical protein
VTAVDTLPAVEGGLADLAQELVTWLETGVRPEGVFASAVFADLTVPHWRLQAEGVDGAFHLREDNHPRLGKVRVEALDRTSRGFLLQFEERWEDEGQQWQGDRRRPGQEAETDPWLGRHLSNRVRDGLECRYVSDPDHPVQWLLQAGV